MKFISILFCCIGFCFRGQSQQTINGTITNGNIQREYILYVPASYHPGTPAPLVMNFHGYTSNALEQMFYGDFRPIADTAGFLVVHPQGTPDNLGNNHWNVGWGSSTVDDIGFTRALIDSLSATYSIDPARIYSTGMSNGGFFSYLLACELSDRIAAIASVTGTMNANATANCNPDHPMPVMEIHGTSDPTVPYDGTIFFSPIPTVLNFWVNFNECNSTPLITPIADINTDDQCTAENQLYSGGSNGSTVEHYKITGGVHAWPGSAFGSAGTNQDVDASKEIWRFFSKYNIHGLIGTTSTIQPASNTLFSVFPNPAKDFISIEANQPGTYNYSISNLNGQIITSGIFDHQKSNISLSKLSPGMYNLSIEHHTFRIVKE